MAGRRIDIGDGLRKVSGLQQKSADTLAGIPAHLKRALEQCAQCDKLIPEEIAPLKARKLKAEKDLHDYIDYQIDLVEKQLTRAAEEARRRLDFIRSLDTPQKRDEEMQLCAPILEGSIHWFRNWAWTVDPREDCSISIIPMKPFDFQEDLIRWHDNLVFIERGHGLLLKSRDMTASWSIIALKVKHFLFRAHYETLLGSRKEELVDSYGEMESLFEKARFILKMLPSWMLPEAFDWKRDVNFCRITNPANGSSIGGESSNPDLGRGGRYSDVDLDEFASFPKGGFQAHAACSQSTKSIIQISTPKGKINQFYRTYAEGNVSIFTLHWKLHPWKTQAWYDFQKRIMSREMLAQEVDMDFEASQPGQIFPMYREIIHVITKSEFMDVYGEAAVNEDGEFQIPAHWNLGMAQDVGYTTQHKWVTLWFTRPAEGDPHSECVFLYREYVAPVGSTIRQVANIIRSLEAPAREHQRMTMRLISHEQLGARNTYQKEHNLPFEAWDTKEGYNFGIPQMQNYMEVRDKCFHPFKPYIKEPIGKSRFYIIVDDDQGQTYYNKDTKRWEVKPAKDAKGCKEFRYEAPIYHYPESEEGKPVADMRPYKDKDDAMDPARAVFAQWAPAVAPMSIEKKREKKLPKNLQSAYIKQVQNTEMANRLLMTREFALTEMQLAEKETSDDWRDRVWTEGNTY